jgi:hypothetical protein
MPLLAGALAVAPPSEDYHSCLFSRFLFGQGEQKQKVTQNHTKPTIQPKGKTQESKH